MITPDDANADTADHQVDLDVGENIITVTVTAEDGSTQTYTVTVTRDMSFDATLSMLILSDITLSDPATFASGTTSYTANVGTICHQHHRHGDGDGCRRRGGDYTG